MLKVRKFRTPVNKAMSEISNCCHYFCPTLRPGAHIRDLNVRYRCSAARTV